jgi:hypothetical protein
MHPPAHPGLTYPIPARSTRMPPSAVPARPTLPTDLLPADLPYTRHLPNRPALPTLPKPAASRATYPIPTLCHHSLASRYILHGHPPPPERLTLYRSPHNSTGAARPPERGGLRRALASQSMRPKPAAAPPRTSLPYTGSRPKTRASTPCSVYTSESSPCKAP